MTGRLVTPPFVEITPLDCIPPGSAIAVATPRGRVALFNVRGRLRALDNECMRCGGSLASGRLAGDLVTCPECGWQYDTTTGRVSGLPALRADTFRVDTDHGSIRIGTTPEA